jgi:hypothetical protein
MKLLLTSVLLLSVFLSDCGPCTKRPPAQPVGPFEVDGWKETRDSGVVYVAVLLLRKGESSNNGKVGVRVTEIKEANPCCGDPNPLCDRRATIQFYRPADGRVLCELEPSDRGNNVISCAEEIGVSVIGIRAIDTAEDWVLFDLRR